MTELSNTTSAMSKSLMTRDIFCVCYPARDGLECLQGELAAARKKFFTGKRKKARAGKAELQPVFDGKLSGKMSRHRLYWKKTSGKLALEEAFDQPNGYVVVKKDFRGVTVSRTFFDKEHRWLKSEYYEPWDPARAQVLLKPQPAADLVERFDWDKERQRYQATELHPLPYLHGTAEQSVLTARFGEPTLILSTAEGEFCYCPKKEAQERMKAWEELKDGTIVLMPAWEVKDGALTGEEETAPDTNLSFTSLEEYAKVEPGQPEEAVTPISQVTAPSISSDTAEFTLPVNEPTEQEAKQAEALPEQPAPEEAEPAAAQEPAPQRKQEEAVPAEEPLSEEEIILRAARKAAGLEESPKKAEPEKAAPKEPEPKESTITAAAPVQGVAAAYHGGYVDGRREGFGSYYYKDGTLCYAGGWKNDKKDGLGVSFRNSDHALHVSNWKDGTPGEYVTLFDQNGNLRYSGKMIDGKKQGAGVTRNLEDDTIFVGKWENGQPTGLGSSFDAEGNLLYYGGWKNGLRDGRGTEFDRSGGIVYDGEWKEGKYHNGILYQKLSSAPEEEKDVFGELNE